MTDEKRTIPIYLQIIDRMKVEIANGSLRPGARVMSVREMALELKVNPNTVQRAMSELEREGYVQVVRSSGRLITEDRELIRRLKQERKRELVRRFAEKMRALGEREEEILTELRRYLEETKKTPP